MSALPVKIDALRAEVEAASSPDELQDLRAKVKGVEEFLRSQVDPLEEETRRIAELRLRIERRLGEMLAEVVEHGGDRRSESRCPEVTLNGLGITRKQSSRWQQLAVVPPDTFERYVETAEAPSLNGAIRYYRNQATGETTTGTCTGEDLEILVERGQRFRTIYADPPWSYGNQGTRAATGSHYSTMSVESLCAMPVEKLVEDVAQLHLWTTNAFLPDAFSVINAWGFEYKSVLLWVKTNIGIGNYWRVSHEFLLLGTRGGAAFPDGQHGHRSWVEVGRSEHSRKPVQFRELVEAVSQPARLELFGRDAVKGWVVWGNQIDRDLFHRDVEEYAA